MANTKFKDLIMGIPNVSPKYQNLTEKEYEFLSEEQKKKYEYDDNTRTYKLDVLCWKHQRQHWVGEPGEADYMEYTVTGSEAGYVAAADSITQKLLGKDKQDLHFFKCKSEVWMAKKGITLPLKADTSKAQDDLLLAGHLFEDVARKAMERELNTLYPGAVWEVRMGERMYQCGYKNTDGTLAAPWMVATPDGFVYRDGELYALAEFKNIQYFSPNKAYVDKDQVPPEYYAQTHHYMMTTNINKCFVMCITGNCFPKDFHLLQVEKDEMFCEELFRVEEEFIESLHQNIMPKMDGSDGQDISKLYELLRRASGNFSPELPPVEAKDDLLPVIEEISFIDSEIEALTEQLKSLKERKKELLVSHVFPVAGKSNEIRVPYDEESYFSLSLKDSKETIYVNPEEIKEKEPEAYKESLEYKFSHTLFKKKFPLLYKRYAKVQDTLTEKKENYCKIRVYERKEAV